MAYFHTITDAKTGETMQVPFTPEEEAAWDAPKDYSGIDQATLNAALIEPGSVLRAVALVMLDEINILRQRAGVALRTRQQLEDALKAKMR